MERPKVKEHGDYATNVALQLGKRAGLQPARPRRRMLAERLTEHPGHRVGRGRRARLPQRHASPPAAQGDVAARRRARPASAYGTQRRERRAAASTSSSSVGQPHRPAPPRPRPLGRRRRRDRPGCSRPPARPSPASSTSTTAAPRWTSSARRSWPVAHGQDPRRGRLPRRVRRRARRRGSSRSARSCSSCPTTSSAAVFRDVGYQIQLAEQRAELDEMRTALRRLVLRALAARERRRRARASPGCREQGHTVRGRRRHLDAHHRLRRRQGPRARPLRRRAHLLRVRHRLLRRQARARLRPVHLPARRRPPRLRRPARWRWPPASATPRASSSQVLIGQMVKIMQNGEELKLSKRAGTMVTLRRARSTSSASTRCATRSIRYPVDSPLTLDVAEMTEQEQRQPGLLRPVRPRAAREHPAQRRRPRRAGRRRRVRPERCCPPSARATCCAPSPSTRAWWRGRPSCVSRTASRATSRTTASTFHKFYDTCRVLPQGDEETTDLHRARLVLVAATRQVLANGLDAARRPRTGADVDARSHEAGALHGRGRRPRTGVAARARGRRTSWCRTCGPPASPRSTACSRWRGSPLPISRPSSARRSTSSTRTTSAHRARAFQRGLRRAPTSTTPARRSSAWRRRDGSPRRA